MMKFKDVVLAGTLAIFNFDARAAEEYIELEPVDVKAEKPAEAGYSVENTASATRTDTPIKETPQSIHIIPRLLIDDQQNVTASEALKNVSSVVTNAEFSPPVFETTRVRGFAAEQLIDGFTQYYNPGDRESLVNVQQLEVLKGYKATSHWITLDTLSKLGAIPVNQRIVTDRNRITGGGVTAGLDFGLEIIAKLRNQSYAEAVQLYLEYNPQPPFNAGSMATAPKEVTAFLNEMFAPLKETANQTALRAAKNIEFLGR